MVTRKKKYLETLAAYFISKGRVLTEKEYKEATDTPMRFFFIKRYIGKWAKMELMLRKNFPEVYEVLAKPKVEVPKPAPVVKKAEPKKVVKDEKE